MAERRLAAEGTRRGEADQVLDSALVGHRAEDTRWLNTRWWVLKRLFSGEKASWAWGVNVEDIVRHGLATCIEGEEPVALSGMRQFFLLPSVSWLVLVTAFAETRAYFARLKPREDVYFSAVIDRLDPLLGPESVQRFLGATKSPLDPFRVVQRGQTPLTNLACGYLGTTVEVLGRFLSFFSKSFRPHPLGNTGRRFLFRMSHEEAGGSSAGCSTRCAPIRRRTSGDGARNSRQAEETKSSR